MLREVVRMLKSEKRRVGITAPTGIAALAVGGCTFHSWAKVGLGQGSVHALYNKLMTQKFKSAKFDRQNDRNHIWNTDVLIVDEISMVRVVSNCIFTTHMNCFFFFFLN
jgi:ATP-dependent DNA helicase PIF1